ncbi:MerR family transcriptional regulator [Corynebacterium uberis]|nr:MULTISPECIES: MerR family transcriptional regulator [Corynebacterium]MCZ9308700.1 MerR family transcriptional regulator [Corynebacterium sp. c6VSa_13]UDL74711.1 MerR family transcriptional regulator [Corynebacterium uberis]UDL76943.1 MerR family transcriptional regulator [Corynebacterium uberis]UDL79154.1 MerR family transcriptional regulator [Corynebacterium uberis]UDL81359.1 MerR family transcriptional regulator [Corynebacterium uberis]
MSIGVVLERLREEFPDVTVSKIRFLESEGLVTPQRTASGYRRFTEEDVQRLRYILVTQRDNYLPLKVIREQLEAMDSGQVTAILTAGDTKTLVSPENFRAPAATRLTDADVATQAGVDLPVIAELVKAKLIHPDAAGFFTADDVTVVATVEALRGFGFDLRHVGLLRGAARRQADLIAQVAAPVARSGMAGARQRAEDTAQQMSALTVSLHAALVKAALREDLGW